eukprot:s5507_g1.t1
MTFVPVQADKTGPKCQALSNTLWSFANLEYWHRPLKEAISQEALRIQTELTTQEVTNMCWALAKLWCHDSTFLKALAVQAMEHADELNKQEISVMAWAFATLNFRHQALLGSLGMHAINRMSEFGELEISNTAWAFARIAVRNDRLMNSISDASMARAHPGVAGPGTVDSIEGLNPNGIYSIAGHSESLSWLLFSVWSSWRTGRAQLMASLARQEPDADPEPLVRGLLLMESANSDSKGFQEPSLDSSELIHEEVHF